MQAKEQMPEKVEISVPKSFGLKIDSKTVLRMSVHKHNVRLLVDGLRGHDKKEVDLVT